MNQSNTEKTYTWEVSAVNRDAKDTVRLQLAMASRPNFIAGQYLTVLLPGHDPVEGKAYSIASAPSQTSVELIIRNVGAFSNHLCTRAVGDTLTTTGPYGFFYPEEPYPKKWTFIAGGIGITPCVSIIRDLLNKGCSDPITLLYSNKKEESIACKDTLDLLETKHPNFSIKYHLTQETASAPFMEGRITTKNLAPFTDTSLFICGSISFVRDIYTLTKELSIPQTQIYTESFF